MLKAARSVAGDGQVIAVVQPHRYTRLRDLFDGFCTCFNDADTVIVAPVYAAGEAPIEGVDRDALVEGLRIRGHRDARALAGPRGAGRHGPGHRPARRHVVCLGAGSISAVGLRAAGGTGEGWQRALESSMTEAPSLTGPTSRATNSLRGFVRCDRPSSRRA